MAMSRFKPALQISNLRRTEELGYITNLQFKRNFLNGSFTFTFDLTQQQIEGEDVPVHFSKYRIRIDYTKNIAPKIFVESPQITKRIHQYSDGSLCLYHRDNFKWGDDKSISKNLIPWVYSWVYFHFMWLKTGKWYGDEYKH